MLTESNRPAVLAASCAAPPFPSHPCQIGAGHNRAQNWIGQGRNGVHVHRFDYSKAQNSAVGIVDVARWEQYSQTSDFPFKAMWYSVPPGGNSPLDQHPEIELSLVMRGEATVESGGSRTVVGQGSAFLLSSTEAHIVHNATDEPLLIFSAYWMPAGMRDGES